MLLSYVFKVTKHGSSALKNGSKSKYWTDKAQADFGHNFTRFVNRIWSGKDILDSWDKLDMVVNVILYLDYWNIHGFEGRRSMEGFQTPTKPGGQGFISNFYRSIRSERFYQLLNHSI